MINMLNFVVFESSASFLLLSQYVFDIRYGLHVYTSNIYVALL